MTFRIEMHPSGRVFQATRQESLLEAALRAGLSPQYRCSNGSCGQCRARLLSGAVGNGRFHDFRLSAADQANGWFLLCCASPAANLVVEAAVADGVADIPAQEIAARVDKIERLGAGIVGLRLRTPRTQALRFLAGQHVRLTIPGFAPRSKSIASCPCHATALEFHVRHAPQDPFAEHVFTRLKPGDPVSVQGPWGRFTLCEDSRRPALFLAYETGLAPIKSLIEHAVAIEYPGPLHLYWAVRAPGGHYLANWCRSLVDALDHFYYTPIGCAGIETEDRRAAAHDLLAAARRMLADHPRIADYDVYAGGPPANMAAARALLLERGLPQEQLFIDDPPRF